MKGTWVCDVCHRSSGRVYVTDRLERRTEYRRVSDQGRQWVVKTGDVCRECAAIEVGAVRGVPKEQGGLW